MYHIIFNTISNTLLLYSSIIFSIILSFFCYQFYENDNVILIWLVFLGLFTSIVNHMYKYQVFQYVDRITMIIGFLSILYISVERKLCIPIIGIIFTSFLYFLSKYTENILYHLFAHLFVTITIVFLLAVREK